MKARRHQLILTLIAEQVIETQDELVAALRAHGLHVTQATVSRDIKELRLAKVATADGRYRYALPAAPPHGSHDALERAQRAFDEYVISVDYVGNLLMVKTLPGSAMVVAACIDALNLEGVLGTVAGDDSVLVVTREPERRPPTGPTKAVYEKLAGMAGLRPPST